MTNPTITVEIEWLAGDGTQVTDRHESPSQPTIQLFPGGHGMVSLRGTDRQIIGGAMYRRVVAVRWGTAVKA